MAELSVSQLERRPQGAAAVPACGARTARAERLAKAEIIGLLKIRDFPQAPLVYPG
jgi:hypothetical protein